MEKTEYSNIKLERYKNTSIILKTKFLKESNNFKITENLIKSKNSFVFKKIIKFKKLLNEIKLKKDEYEKKKKDLKKKKKQFNSKKKEIKNKQKKNQNQKFYKIIKNKIEYNNYLNKVLKNKKKNIFDDLKILKEKNNNMKKFQILQSDQLNKIKEHNLKISFNKKSAMSNYFKLEKKIKCEKIGKNFILFCKKNVNKKNKSDKNILFKKHKFIRKNFINKKIINKELKLELKNYENKIRIKKIKIMNNFRHNFQKKFIILVNFLIITPKFCFKKFLKEIFYQKINFEKKSFYQNLNILRIKEKFEILLKFYIYFKSQIEKKYEKINFIQMNINYKESLLKKIKNNSKLFLITKKKEKKSIFLNKYQKYNHSLIINLKVKLFLIIFLLKFKKKTKKQFSNFFKQKNLKNILKFTNFLIIKINQNSKIHISKILILYNKFGICYFKQILTLFKILRYFLLKLKKENYSQYVNNSYRFKSFRFNSIQNNICLNKIKKNKWNRSEILDNSKKKFKLKNRKTYIIKKLNLIKEKKVNESIHDKLIKKSKSKNLIIKKLNLIFYSLEKNKCSKLQNLNLKGKYFKKKFSFKQKLNQSNSQYFHRKIKSENFKNDLSHQTRYINKIKKIDFMKNKNISSFIKNK